jgi:hypothetical protein
LTPLRLSENLRQQVSEREPDRRKARCEIRAQVRTGGVDEFGYYVEEVEPIGVN